MMCIFLPGDRGESLGIPGGVGAKGERGLSGLPGKLQTGLFMSRAFQVVVFDNMLCQLIIG